MHEKPGDHRESDAVDHGVDELWVADEPIGYTLLPDSDLMLGIESRPTEPRRRSPLQPTC